jgi:hypothetical protein
MRTLRPAKASARAITLLSILAPLAPLLTACGGDATTDLTFTTRDSAGIVIAENRGEPPADGGGWALAPEPSLRIGAMDGDEAYLLFRVWGATRLSDGRIAVANNRAPDIRIFSPTGEHLQTFGRLGEGPGEFDSPVLMGALPGDTLVVVDRTLRRVDLFHPDEGFIEGVTATTDIPGYLLTTGMFSSGSVVVWTQDWTVDLPNGLFRFPVRYWSVGRNGQVESDLGEYPGDETVYSAQTTEQGIFTASVGRPFGKGPSTAVSGSRLFYGSQDAWEIQVHDQTGKLVRLIRREKAPIPVTDTDVSAIMEEMIDDADDSEQVRQYRRLFREAPIPDFHPAYGDIHADALGFLWVEEYRLPGDATRVTTIFDTEGRMVGSLNLPSRFQVYEIGEEYLLGRHVDELGVEYLYLYDLMRPG